MGSSYKIFISHPADNYKIFIFAYEAFFSRLFIYERIVDIYQLMYYNIVIQFTTICRRCYLLKFLYQISFQGDVYVRNKMSEVWRSF